MKKVNIVYGTVYDQARSVATELQALLSEKSLDNELIDEDALPSWRPPENEILLVVCSSTGMGDLPDQLVPWYLALEDEHPDWGSLEVGLIGLGDSSYEVFNGAIQTIETLALELGARLIKETLKLDATVHFSPHEDAKKWLSEYMDLSSSN